NHPVLMRVTQAVVDAPVVHTFVVGEASADAERVAARVLGADDDFSPFYTVARADDRLWSVVEPLYGLHHFGAETVFEALSQVIIEQQISLAAALKAQRALAEWGGGRVEYDGHTHYTFPHPERIAEADPMVLHSILKITHRRVETMQRVARDVVCGALDLEALREVDAPTAYKALMAIKGVGHWTAAWTLIRGLGRYDYAAHNDVALRDAVAHYFYDTDERVSADTVAQLFAGYAPYSGLAAFYTLMAWAVARY
ncbi:MAG: hypothetical protein AAF125_22315, partial [Chloroflexota bacterium]